MYDMASNHVHMWVEIHIIGVAHTFIQKKLFPIRLC